VIKIKAVSAMRHTRRGRGRRTCLVEEPFPDLRALLEGLADVLAGGVEALCDVEEDGPGLPDDVVVVGVVDDGGDTAVTGRSIR